VISMPLKLISASGWSTPPLLFRFLPSAAVGLHP